MVSLQGERNADWSRNKFRLKNEVYKRIMSEAGFQWLDMDTLTASWPIDTTGEQDGFHYPDNVQNMAAMVMLNMICNAELSDFVGKPGAPEWYQTIDSKRVTNPETSKYYVAAEKAVDMGKGIGLVNVPVFNERKYFGNWMQSYNIVDARTFPLFGE